MMIGKAQVSHLTDKVQVTDILLFGCADCNVCARKEEKSIREDIVHEVSLLSTNFFHGISISEVDVSFLECRKSCKSSFKISNIGIGLNIVHCYMYFQKIALLLSDNLFLAIVRTRMVVI